MDVSHASADQTSTPTALPGDSLGAPLLAPSPKGVLPADASAPPSAEAPAAILAAAPAAVSVSAFAVGRPHLQQPADEQDTSASASEGAPTARKPLTSLYDTTALPPPRLDGNVWDDPAAPASLKGPGVFLITVPVLMSLCHMVDGAHSHLRILQSAPDHASQGAPDVLVHMHVPAGCSVCSEVLLQLLPRATDAQRAVTDVLFVYAACKGKKRKWERHLNSNTSADDMQALEATSRRLHASTVVVDLRRWAGDRTSKLRYCDVVHHVVFNALPDPIDYMTLHETLCYAFELCRSNAKKTGSKLRGPVKMASFGCRACGNSKGKVTSYFNDPCVIRVADVAASNLSRVVVAHLPDACDELQGQMLTSTTRMGLLKEAITSALHVTHNFYVKQHLDHKDGTAGEHGVGNSGIIAWVGDDEPAVGGVFHNYSALCSIPSRSGVTVTYLRSREQWHGTAAFAEGSKGSRYGVALVNNGNTQLVAFRDAASAAL